MSAANFFDIFFFLPIIDSKNYNNHSNSYGDLCIFNYLII